MLDFDRINVEFEEELSDSIFRINKWLEKRKKDSMIHPQQIHSYWMDNEESQFLVSDLLNVLESASRYLDICY